MKLSLAFSVWTEVHPDFVSRLASLRKRLGSRDRAGHHDNLLEIVPTYLFHYVFPWLLRRDLPHFATREILARGGAIRGNSTLGVPLALHFAELTIEEAVHNLNCPTAPARLVACEFNALAAALDFA